MRNGLIIGVEQRRPEVMSRALPIHLPRTVLKPVSQGHVTVRQVDRIGPSGFGRHRVLLRKDQAHDLTQLHILQKELDMNRIGLIILVRIAVVLDKIVFGDHLDIRIVRVDGHRPAKGHRDRAISGEQRPPDSLPEPLVLSTQL